MSEFAQALSKHQDRRSSSIKHVITTSRGGGFNMSDMSGSITDVGQSDNALQLFRFFKETLYTVVNAISERVSQQPFCAGEAISASENDISKAWRARRWVQKDLIPDSTIHKTPNQDVLAIIQHPALDALNNPNPHQSKMEFLHILAVNYLVTGRCYIIHGVVTDEDGNEQLEMWAIPTNWMTPNHSDGLFSSFIMNPTGSTTSSVTLNRNQVAWASKPDPTDPKESFSTVHAILQSLRISGSIDTCQDRMFSHGIYPNVILTVGQKIGPNGEKLGRPRLDKDQRTQLIRAVMNSGAASMNYHMPIVLDRMIESVHKLQMTPNEMDFNASKAEIEKRIYRAFKVSQVSVGETTGANRSTGAEAKLQFAEQAVNPVVGAISGLCQKVVSPFYEEPKNLLVYLNNYHPVDETLKLAQWNVARRNGDVSDDEFRTSVLGVPPRSNNVIFTTVEARRIGVEILSKFWSGQATDKQTVAALHHLLSVPIALAEQIVTLDGDRVSDFLTEGGGMSLPDTLQPQLPAPTIGDLEVAPEPASPILIP